MMRCHHCTAARTAIIIHTEFITKQPAESLISDTLWITRSTVFSPSSAIANYAKAPDDDSVPGQGKSRCLLGFLFSQSGGGRGTFEQRTPNSFYAPVFPQPTRVLAERVIKAYRTPPFISGIARFPPF
jgi:hypothetical protein